MFDRRLSLRPTPHQMSLTPIPSISEMEMKRDHELWRRPQIAPKPLWKSVANRIFLPMDWSYDRIFNLICRIFSFMAEEHPCASLLTSVKIAIWAENNSSHSAKDIARNWCGMTPERLGDCLAMLRWIHKDIANRYLACARQLQKLDKHIRPDAMPLPCPQWTPSPRAGECLKWMVRWAERIDEGIPVPQRLDFGPLTREQSGEIVVGIRILKELYDLKQMERPITAFVQNCGLAKTIAKIGIFAPPVMMLICPKIWPIQLSLPLVGVLLFIKSELLCIKAIGQFGKYRMRINRITYWFSVVHTAACQNYHRENKRLERAEGRKRRKEQKRSNRAKAQLELRDSSPSCLVDKLVRRDLKIASLEKAFHKVDKQMTKNRPFNQLKLFWETSQTDWGLYCLEMYKRQKVFFCQSVISSFSWAHFGL